jgi:hypothetical protein
LRPFLAITMPPVVAALAVLSREVAVATIVVTCVVAFALRVVSARQLLVNVLAALSAFLVDLAQPYHQEGFDLRSLWSAAARYAIHHPVGTLRNLFMGAGFATAALLPTVVVRLTKDLTTRRHLAVLIPAGVVPILVAFGALDFGRLASAATPVLSVLLAFYLVAAASDLQRLLLGAAAAVFLAEWTVFGLVVPTRHGYVAYFSGRTRFGAPTLVFLAVIGAAIVMLDAKRLVSSENVSEV